MPSDRRTCENCSRAEETGLALAIKEGLKTSPVRKQKVLDILQNADEN